MIQLTDAQRAELRARAAKRPDLVQAMQESVQTLMDEPVIVPSTGVANWGLYYYCPDCSVQLAFDRHDNRHHRCPQCGKIHQGEPYDGSWWQHMNSYNYEGAVTLGWLYVMTGDERYAAKARDILIAYGRNYPNYEVHGDIPYNGPGRAGAQTLDEANFQRNLAIAFDLVSETMTDAEIDLVRDGMFIPGGEFLMAHRVSQLHNHEVIVNSAIASIGLLFDREDMVNFALYTPYGMLYQLEQGMLENGMWFEGSFGYHLYALISFLAYEKFALNTKHSHIHHPNYRKMMDIVFFYLTPESSVPMMGDTNYRHMHSMFDIYEFVYRELRSPQMLYILHKAYDYIKRDHLEAVIYGVDELPPCPDIELPQRFHPQPGHSGHVILRGSQGRYLLLKCDRYGGEHDHYDRLGIDYHALGCKAAPDLGTTGYGAVMHYDYYKNTGSHNIVVIGEENQAPADAVLTRFEEKDGVTYVEAVCDWTALYRMPDSFTIVQWDEEAYKTVKMRRSIAWTDDYFAEVYRVEGVEQGRTVDWVMHLSGEMTSAHEGQAVERLSEKKPYKHIHDVIRLTGSEARAYAFCEDGVTTTVYSASFGGETYLGAGPHNPSYKEIRYLIERVREPQAVFAHVIESARGQGKIDRVKFELDGTNVGIEIGHRDGSTRNITL